MQVKSIISLVPKVLEEYNKDKLPSERLTIKEAEKIIKSQFEVINDYMHRPFYPHLKINNLFSIETKISFVSGVLYYLIDVMKKARDKGIQGEKDYYEAAVSFNYWRALYLKSFVFKYETAPAKKTAWAKKAQESADKLREKRKNNQIVRQVRIPKSDWSIADKCLPYEEWILTEDYLKDPLHKRHTWGKNLMVRDYLKDHVLNKLKIKEKIKEKNLTFYEDVNTFNKLLKDIKIRKKNK